MYLPPPQTRASREHAELGSVLRTKARSFAFASRFLDPERRRAAEILYAFFRTVDDLVDERPPGSETARIAAELDRWDAWLADPRREDGVDALKTALAEVLTAYAIPPSYLRALLLGLREDLEGRTVETFEDLERYSFRVAGSVGLAMCHVLGTTTRSALTAATALGIGMQLTNILRDVAEDLARDRVYLPADELAHFGCSREGLSSRAVDEALRALLQFHVERARRYYVAGVVGIAELSPEARYPIALAATLYGRILDKIEAQRYDVFVRRAAVSRREKLILAGRLALAMRVQRGWGKRMTPMDGLGPAALAELAAIGAPGFDGSPSSESLLS